MSKYAVIKVGSSRVGYRENSKIVKVKSIQGLESAEEE